NTPQITGGSIMTGDTANFIETYDTKNAGVGKTLTPSGSVSDSNLGNNYTYNFVAQPLGEIDTVQLTVTANDYTQTYNGLAGLSSIVVQITGFVVGETSAVLDFSGFTMGGTSQTALDVGTYSYIPSGIASTNYTFNYVNGTLTIQPRTTTISLSA